MFKDNTSKSNYFNNSSGSGVYNYGGEMLKTSSKNLISTGLSSAISVGIVKKK